MVKLYFVNEQETGLMVTLSPLKWLGTMTAESHWVSFCVQSCSQAVELLGYTW